MDLLESRVKCLVPLNEIPFVSFRKFLILTCLINQSKYLLIQRIYQCFFFFFKIVSRVSRQFREFVATILTKFSRQLSNPTIFGVVLKETN